MTDEKAVTGDSKNQEGKVRTDTAPILILEYSFTISRILVVLVTALTAGFSLLSGCRWPIVLIRAGSVALLLGLILYGLNLLMVEGTLDTIFAQVAALKKQEEDGTSTQEWKV